MSDIVERLRKQAWRRSGAPKMEAGHAKMLEWEAADEIEKLRGRGVFGDDGVPRLVAVDDETFRLTMLDELRALREAVERIERKYANAHEPG